MFFPGEAHDNKSQYGQTVEHPDCKAEVIDECVDVSRDDIYNSYCTLKVKNKQTIHCGGETYRGCSFLNVGGGLIQWPSFIMYLIISLTLSLNGCVAFFRMIDH